MRVSLRVFRGRPGAPGHHDRFEVEVPEAATVVDVIEAAWARHDRTLMFRHACHHGSCGSCGAVVQGRERLPCVTPVREVWSGHGDLRVEPLRNFPLVGDLVVDVAGLFQRMTASGMSITRTAEPHLAGAMVEELPAGIRRLVRFENCIECGLCVSACPTMAADDRFFGPAGLAGVERAREAAGTGDGGAERLLRLVDGEQGAWRCHGAWECSEVCPQGVEPAESIMELRRQLLVQRVRRRPGAVTR